MKKLLITVLLLAGFVACSTSSKKVEDKYAHITPESIEKAMGSCEDEGRWFMPIGGVPIVVLHLKDCLGVTDLLFMATPSDSYTPDIRSQSLKLLSLHFLEHLKVKDASKVWLAKPIKTFDIPTSTEPPVPGQLIMLFEINGQPKETK